MSTYIDENPEYWADYNNLQRVKHELLRRYLGGWFPILGSWSGRIIYIDCHAGRGKHITGQTGSPLIALEVFLNHPARDRILKNCEVHFFFIEADEKNKEILEKNLSGYKLPRKVIVTAEHGRFEEILQTSINQLHEKNAELAPAFVFVDPYGFKLPGRLLAQLKEFTKCELFITFMWRWIDMALHHPAQEGNMDALFLTPNWRNLRNILDPDERCEAAIRLLGERIGANYLTRVKMLGEHEEVKYVLIHSTGHQKGRELMLWAVRKICPAGGFKARINDSPDQEYLIKPEPNLEPLENWLRIKYRNKAVATNQIYADMLDPSTGIPFLEADLHEVLRKLFREGTIVGPGKLVFKSNPTIRFIPQKQVTKSNYKGERCD
ncbi:MAG: three-Cys-motif partner protein TcmP [Candidatus Acidiferrales bacterium]|jgi:three-Cys-motif partner protein